MYNTNDNTFSPSALRELVAKHLTDEQAEISVLGGLFVMRDYIPRILNDVGMQPEDFGNSQHGLTFLAMKEVYEDDGVNGLTLPRVAARIKALQKDGKTQKKWQTHIEEPITFLTRIVSAAPDGLNLVTDASRVNSLARRQALVAAATEITNLAVFGEEYETQRLVEMAHMKLFEVFREAEGGSGLQHIGVYGKESRERYALIKSGQLCDFFIPTAFEGVNGFIVGFERGSLTFIVARPSKGKTAFALDCVLTAAEQFDKRVALFSLETPGQQLFDRLVAMKAALNSQAVRRAELSQQEETLFFATNKELSTLPIFIDDASGVTPMQLRQRCQYYYFEQGIDIIFIDYLQLMDPDDARHNLNEAVKVDRIARALKVIARQLNIPIVALGQLSRQVEQRVDKRPILSDVRYGGEQHADVVVGLYNEESDVTLPDNADSPEAPILKNRNGPTGTAPLDWLKEIARFKDRDVIHLQELDAEDILI